MRKKPGSPVLEVTGDATIRHEHGIDTRLARDIRHRVRTLECEATIETPQGKVADARSLLHLLLLGVAVGETVVVRCRGPEAVIAREAIVALVEGRS
ncbi:HPr family phosphocarrier protein [Paraliomyxa miuraensis]|uniref:HPr family phosphocarrier protein n=1 Tax=Paraliomyxa miuraensis TaxID=376150 RepID=UPI00224D7C3D|nr:HPr family phosphocarrier protein [Paraliomyxa miuraensis]MCX4243802.1 HPr family phosphocarrier protein [Paraliomyxa miuraensis]